MLMKVDFSMNLKDKEEEEKLTEIFVVINAFRRLDEQD